MYDHDSQCRGRTSVATRMCRTSCSTNVEENATELAHAMPFYAKHCRPSQRPAGAAPCHKTTHALYSKIECVPHGFDATEPNPSTIHIGVERVAPKITRFFRPKDYVATRLKESRLPINTRARESPVLRSTSLQPKKAPELMMPGVIECSTVIYQKEPWVWDLQTVVDRRRELHEMAIHLETS